MISSRTRVALAAAAATVAGLAVPALAVSPAATTGGWVATQTQALTLTDATRTGTAAPDTALRLTLGLAPRNRTGLAALIKAQTTPGTADYEHFLTPAKFTSRFAATTATASAVSRYLLAQGMTDVTVTSNRLEVTANATVSQAERAFHTAISTYTQRGKAVLANTAGASVPRALAGAVTSVLGLSSLGVRALPPTTLPNLNGFYPKQFNTVYDTGTTKPGTGLSLAVIAEGNLAPTLADLRRAEANQRLPRVPVSLQYAGIKSPDVSATDEWDLDTQTSTGIATNVKDLYLYIATSLTDSDLARALNLFAAQDKAQAGSASLGECDLLPYVDGAMTVDDIIFAEAAAQGQTFFASSGDTGSSCAVAPTNGVPGSGVPDVEYPASSPYVVGVGGTTLDASATGTYGTEIAWNAGGGGISPVENSPYWQNGVVPSAAAGIRGVPDVAFDADPNTGALVYVNGTLTQIGGTSLSSPMAMGLWTRINATHNGRLGFAAPKLYALYAAAQHGSPLPPADVPGFHDVVLGGNGLYIALPGYDYTSGLGSWDVSRLSRALR